jgi:hypothetical protein
METHIHREKIARLDELRSRLDPKEAFEIWMWTSMSAATHALNAAMHELGVTHPGDLYPHQIPGIYVERVRVDGQWRKVAGIPGDVIHIGLPTVVNEIPPVIHQAANFLRVIEDMREPFVRGDDPITESIIVSCGEAYVRCMALLRGIIEGKQPEGVHAT